jgi:hypothetical protein
MSEVRESIYLNANVCSVCGWFQSPELCSPPRAICPDCGGDLQTKRGRYQYIVKPSFWHGPRNEYLAFIPL